MVCVFLVFFFKQKTAYEMRISDWSSDVCSSDLGDRGNGASRLHHQSVDHLEGLGDRLTIEGSDDNVLELRPVQKASVIFLAEVRVAAGVRVPSPGVNPNLRQEEDGIAHVCTPATNANLVYRVHL